VDHTIRRYDSLTEADAAEAQYYGSLKPEERLEILLDLIEAYRRANVEGSERFERVYRIDTHSLLPSVDEIATSPPSSSM
jgi:hypothetical protein